MYTNNMSFYGNASSRDKYYSEQSFPPAKGSTDRNRLVRDQAVRSQAVRATDAVDPCSSQSIQEWIMKCNRNRNNLSIPNYKP